MHVNTPLQSSLSDFYDSMSQTARKAASLVNRPTADYARDLRSSLERTLRSVDRLTQAIDPSAVQYPTTRFIP